MTFPDWAPEVLARIADPSRKPEVWPEPVTAAQLVERSTRWLDRERELAYRLATDPRMEPAFKALNEKLEPGSFEADLLRCIKAAGDDAFGIRHRHEPEHVDRLADELQSLITAARSLEAALEGELLSFQRPAKRYDALRQAVGAARDEAQAVLTDNTNRQLKLEADIRRSVDRFRDLVPQSRDDRESEALQVFVRSLTCRFFMPRCAGWMPGTQARIISVAMNKDITTNQVRSRLQRFDVPEWANVWLSQ